MGRKEGSQRAVWPSGRPPRPTWTIPNPPDPGQTATFASQTGLPKRRGGRPSPFALPPPLRKKPPAAGPTTAPTLDEDPLQPLDFNPVNRASSTAGDLRFTKVIGMDRNR